MKEKSALIVGASGLVGSELLQILLNEGAYRKITAIVRKPLGIQHPKLEEKTVDFNHLDHYSEYFIADDVFCCLGTTIKKAGTKEEMTKVDVGYPLAAAKLSFENGASKFLVISSMGADPDALVAYSRMKGMLEQELSKVGFQSLHIFRPSLLLGNRKEFRAGESAAGFLFPLLSFLLVGPLKKYKAIQAATVALAMYRAAQSGKKGKTIYLSDEIQDIAQ
ncbi:NAD-dependent epimerase/dehydratase family protein [Peribacillus glennii]|uniref:NAD-dependent epimerase/dehydratase family protein n=1 Tax=Peribacillus glennii TaxID=2303991 RepID=A0A372LBZ1_9BACI|nr:NAD-dependent epimerase/dehydratase family protein [Peribacillus glennii]RFU62443.1 NAD-dependent epimerase/dehydratase family protein [Peribacillus glennii]